MTYDVEVNGRTRRVDIEPGPAGFIVTVDGRRHVADVTGIDGVWSLILESDASNASARRSYAVAIVEQPAGSGILTVHVNGRVVVAAVGAARGRASRRGHRAASGSTEASTAPQAVTAPMPGKVVKVLVRRGEVVAARQGVVVVEAMKMENELRAPKAGTVAEINVAEGTSVEAGAILAVIE